VEDGRGHCCHPEFHPEASWKCPPGFVPNPWRATSRDMSNGACSCYRGGCGKSWLRVYPCNPVYASPAALAGSTSPMGAAVGWHSRTNMAEHAQLQILIPSWDAARISADSRPQESRATNFRRERNSPASREETFELWSSVRSAPRFSAMSRKSRRDEHESASRLAGDLSRFLPLV